MCIRDSKHFCKICKQKKTKQEKKRHRRKKESKKTRNLLIPVSFFNIFKVLLYRSLPLLMFQVLCRPSLTSPFIAFTPCRHKQSNIGRQENEFKFLPLSISELSHEFMKTTVIC